MLAQRHRAGRRPAGQDEYCWKLAWYWAPLLKRRGRLDELLAVQRTAVLAAGGSATATRSPTCTTSSATCSGRLGDYASADEQPAGGA